MRVLDLFAGQLGWAKAFLVRGWEVDAVDLVVPREIPAGCEFIKQDVLTIDNRFVRDGKYDFICASSPCEEFSVHGMKHFHPNPKYPTNGIALFEHTRALCEASGLPYVMENVRAAQKFVGQAVHHCGPFYLWGSGVPLLLNQGIKKGNSFRGAPGNYMDKCPPGVDLKKWRMLWQKDVEVRAGSRKGCAALAATIPPELANCVADYAERIIEAKRLTP